MSCFLLAVLKIFLFIFWFSADRKAIGKKLNKTKSCFLEKINKFGNPFTRLAKGKKERRLTLLKTIIKKETTLSNLKK